MTALLAIRELQHTYLPGTPLAAPALQAAHLTVQAGEIAALVGPSGAGKSTLVHFINGLLRPVQPGRVVVFGQDTADSHCDLGALRRQVGLVFQYPHQQLFERYVADDVAYGPRQLGLAEAELVERVRWAMSAVGLDFERFAERHTFSLSGGEMRRAALAGVVAMQPQLIVLDEATTGLDPRGRREVHTLIRRLRDEEGIATLLVSNDMEEVAELAERVTVLKAGVTVFEGTPRDLFAQAELAGSLGLLPPVASQVVHALDAAGLPVDTQAVTLQQAEETVWQAMRR